MSIEMAIFSLLISLTENWERFKVPNNNFKLPKVTGMIQGLKLNQ